MTYLEHCRYRNCDGVVIASVDFYDPSVIELVQSDIPTVTIDHVFDNRTAIMSDNVSSVRELVQHVYEYGHRKIAFIHGKTLLSLKSVWRVSSKLARNWDLIFLRNT